jgi:hypothetical protein
LINLQLHKETLDIKTKIRLSHKISDFLDNTFNYDGNLDNKVHKLCLDLAHDYDNPLKSDLNSCQNSYAEYSYRLFD